MCRDMDNVATKTWTKKYVSYFSAKPKASDQFQYIHTCAENGEPIAFRRWIDLHRMTIYLS